MCGACMQADAVHKAMRLTCHGPVGREMGYEFAERVVENSELRDILKRCRDAGIRVMLENSKDVGGYGEYKTISVGIRCNVRQIIRHAEREIKKYSRKAA